MLVYEKKVEGVRHLFGTMGTVPSVSDSQLTYKDVDGDTITPVAGDSYVDDHHGGIIRKSDGKFVAVYIGDKNIIPGGSYTPKEKVLDSIKITKKPKTLEYTVGDKLDLTGLKVQAIYTSGDKENITTYTTSPVDEAVLAKTDTTVTVSYTEGSVTKTATFTITVNEAAAEE